MQPHKLLRVATPKKLITALLIFFLPVPLMSSLVEDFSRNLVPYAKASSADEKTYYFLTDHLGSVDVVLDDKGNVVERRDFLPYGSARVSSPAPSTTTTDHKFTGKELDDKTGLYYYGARYYDAVIGRFVSEDPWSGDLSNPQTLNKYAYTFNNPVRFVDPDGAKVSEYQPYKPKNGIDYGYHEEMGEYRGIKILSAGDQTGGTKHSFQCTTFAKEFALSQFGVDLSGTGNGGDYGDQTKLNAALQKNSPDEAGAFEVHSNGSSVMPQEDDIISWSGHGTGHVGIIAEVVFDNKNGTGQVYTIEQNASHYGGLFVQKLTRSYNEAGQAQYSIANRLKHYTVSGWAHYDSQSRLQNVLMPPYTENQATPATKPIKEQPNS